MKKRTSIRTGWKFIKEDIGLEHAMEAQGEIVSIPHTWNAKDGQDGGNDYYRGRCWYVRRVFAEEFPDGEEFWLQFDGAAMCADVYWNGTHMKRHEGGYSAFRVKLTGKILEENILIVSVDNSAGETVYPQKADFTFYGGLYREVSLLGAPKEHFDRDYYCSDGIKVTPNVQGDTAVVTVQAWIKGGAGAVTFTLDGEKQRVNVEDGMATAVFTLVNVHLWDGLKDPYMYTMEAALDSGDAVQVKFGCRSFRADAQKGFYLNGRSYPLRGVCRHQDRAGVGNALTEEMHREDMEILKEIGANTVRLAHYQQAQEFYELCDQKGILVWAEIPYISRHLEKGNENTRSQMHELIVQNYHHPSIACWGLSNEITIDAPADEKVLDNHRFLNELCHRLDPERFTVMASVSSLDQEDEILTIPDVNSYNLYFGWYFGELEQNGKFLDAYHRKYPDRPIGLSEYGADANPCYQTASPVCGDYTEQYQCLFHEHLLQMIEERPWIWASHVWNLFDFAADARDEGGRPGVNQKGLVTLDRKLKKDAFYLYKAYWSREPFVHVCGRRYVNRTEEETEIKVYSNLNRVVLFIDGEEFAAQDGEKVFRFMVSLKGECSIAAKAGDCQDEIRIRKVDTPDPAYRMEGQNGAANWFETETKKEYYSIDDRLADLMKNSQAQELVRGTIRKSMQSMAGGKAAPNMETGGASMVEMAGSMTLRRILQYVGKGMSAEEMQNLNAKLQKIRKEK